MKIHATFANRKYDPDVVELVHAWDEFCVDENPRGYDETKRLELASWGPELLRWVTVEIDVEAAEIYEALCGTPQVAGEITHVGEVIA